MSKRKHGKPRRRISGAKAMPTIPHEQWEPYPRYADIDIAELQEVWQEMNRKSSMIDVINSVRTERMFEEREQNHAIIEMLREIDSSFEKHVQSYGAAKCLLERKSWRTDMRFR